ncbi:MAG: tagaturonate reductase [Oscillospiraceae bacterium]|nr:tagaturonate reductase [Oscillospiraceae bacterium]
MQKINEIHGRTFAALPEKILQVGEGNFLRAFLGPVVERANRAGIFGGSIVITPPRKWDNCVKLTAQDCLYTVVERGVLDGKIVERAEVITSVSRCIDPKREWESLVEVACSPQLEMIVSNTTEAGITYCKGKTLDRVSCAAYPGKLTALLFERYKKLGGDAPKKLLILPCELIDDNGTVLRDCVHKYAEQWKLGGDFMSWLEDSCCFAGTLVDRIVTGFPAEEYENLTRNLGYEDSMITVCEPYFFWAIACEKPYRSMFSMDNTENGVIFADNISMYKTRKVRILNGAHTGASLAAFLSGHDTVREMVTDEIFQRYILEMWEKEVIPTIDMDGQELRKYVAQVLERFENPFVRHRLYDISLNSISKYNARCKGIILDNLARKNDSVKLLAFSLAALIRFYRCELKDGQYIGEGAKGQYAIRDSEEVCRFMCGAWRSIEPVRTVLSNTDFWGEDLSVYEDLLREVTRWTDEICAGGVKKALEKCIGKS